MGGGSAISPEAVASLLTRETGTPFQIRGRLSGGETGAHEFVKGDGYRVVVKWDTRPHSRQLRKEAVGLSERLRTVAAWPVPAETVIDADGTLFVIQDFMPGNPPEQLDHQLVDELLDVHSRRLGLARPDDPVHWPAALIKTLTVGGEGYCLHSSLRAFDGHTRSLIDRVEEFGRSIDEADLVGVDVVHWDLHTGNLLVSGSSLSAVVDTDFCAVGDARFDLAALALSSLTLPCLPGVRTRLFAAAFDDLDELNAQAYLAHLFIRFIDWPIRRGNSDEVSFWLARADELLKI
jgi:aminoglycoside phosphotransferase (APT) family kinase protein